LLGLFKVLQNLKNINLLTFFHNTNNTVIDEAQEWANEVKNLGSIADNRTNIGD
jgi:hypothetical protein